MSKTADIFIIGGGINGTGIARDAAGRGQKVILVEQGDLASATSSSSSKLIHGGLRYLEYYDFMLVRHSLRERETLWKIAPHIIGPLRFVLPHHRGLRPAFLLRIGLFLYDFIGGRTLLPATKSLNLKKHAAGQMLQPIFKKGFEYSDCRVDDARLVILNALSAAEQGATILPHHRFIRAARKDGWWLIDVKDQAGIKIQFKAKALVNAAGPWVDEIQERCPIPIEPDSSVHLVKGSHIIVPKLYDHDKAYTFQHGDGRVIFAIPYEQDFTLIGTTDVAYDGAIDAVRASEEEVQYLCSAVSEYFKNPVQATDVIWSFAGVRPLYDDGSKNASAATRDYLLELDAPDNTLPLLSIFGGKITTYRHLAEAALKILAPYVDLSRSNWTDGEPLPGGDLPDRQYPEEAFKRFNAKLEQDFPWLDNAIISRLAHAYGTRTYDLLGDASCLSDLGQHFGTGLYEKEVQYLMQQEWARTAEDILWRRSKLGLCMNEKEKQSLVNYMAAFYH